MDIPRYSQARAPLYALPEIYIQGSNISDRMTISNRSSLSTSRPSPPSSSIPMSIPHARDDGSPPPPLPPPRFADTGVRGGGSVDPGYEWASARDQHSWGHQASVKSGSSLYGSFSRNGSGVMDESDLRRGNTASTIKSISGIDGRQNSYPRNDEGYASISTGSSMSSNHPRYDEATSGRNGFQSSVHDRFRPTDSAKEYDRGLLQKLGSRKMGEVSTSPQSYGKAPFSTSLNEAPQSYRFNRHMAPTQKPLSLPSMKTEFSGSPGSRWGNGSALSTTPVNNGGVAQFGYRSPSERDDMERSPRPSSRQAAWDMDDASSVSHSYQGSHFLDNEADFQMEETGLRRLRIDDSMTRADGYSPSSAAGQKRRASSPPHDGYPSLHSANSLSDLHRRRESAASRASPVPSRQHSLHGSISSTASGPRSNSFCSVQSLAPNSAVSTVDSYGRLSPGGISTCLSPGGISPGGVSPRAVDSGNESPYPASFKLNNAPYDVPANAPQARPISAKRAIENMSQSKGGVLKVQSGYVCDCCPKKPKKFETEAALNAHEAEKQYECAYCKNRFKNKNEAERHQNSLHLRRHSWSCAALTEYSDAFHSSPSNAGIADACGYCGEEFPRTIIRSHNGRESSVVAENEWSARVQHLVDVHKFRECNHTKKFFRADHFRQHLKHSHAGTSGKWTNMLENACMKDEPLPEPIRGPEIVRLGSLNGRVSRITEETE